MSNPNRTPNIFKDIYTRLYKRFGPQHWWPGDTRFEIIVGAILTQNTSWSNVEKAIKNLKRENLLSPAKLMAIDKKRLAGLIRPAGYYNIKAARIKNFLNFLSSQYNSSLRKMSSAGTVDLRKQLLSVNGIGPETCDSILLYAFDRPVFVIDAYTRRIFSRHGRLSHDMPYESMQAEFAENLPSDSRLFNEYHALIVRLAKEFCRTSPRCEACPLSGIGSVSHKALANRKCG